MQFLGEKPPGDHKPSVGRGVLDALDEYLQPRAVELLRVVDDDCPFAEWFVEQRTELTAESKRPLRSGAA
jgi:hypothetical protein